MFFHVLSPYRMKITPDGWLLPWMRGWQLTHERFRFQTWVGSPGHRLVVTEEMAGLAQARRRHRQQLGLVRSVRVVAGQAVFPAPGACSQRNGPRVSAWHS